MKDITPLQQRRNQILEAMLPRIKSHLNHFIASNRAFQNLAADMLQSAILKVAHAIDVKLSNSPTWSPEHAGFNLGMVIRQAIVDAQRLDRVIQSPRGNRASRMTPTTFDAVDGIDWFGRVEDERQATRRDCPTKILEQCRSDIECIIAFALLAGVRIVDIARQNKISARTVRAIKAEIGRRFLAAQCPDIGVTHSTYGANGKAVVDDKGNEYPSIAAAAQKLSVTPDTISRWVKRGKWHFAKDAPPSGADPSCA